MASFCGNTVGDAAYASDDFACRTANGGYSFFIISGSPSAAQIAKMCGIPACLTEIAAIQMAQPTECVVHNKLQLYRDILDPIHAGCSNQHISTVTTTEPKDFNGSTPPAPAKTTTTPATAAVFTKAPVPIHTTPPSYAPINKTIGSTGGSEAAMIIGIGGGVMFVAFALAGFLVVRSRRQSHPLH